MTTRIRKSKPKPQVGTGFSTPKTGAAGHLDSSVSHPPLCPQCLQELAVDTTNKTDAELATDYAEELEARLAVAYRSALRRAGLFRVGRWLSLETLVVEEMVAAINGLAFVTYTPDYRKSDK